MTITVKRDSIADAWDEWVDENTDAVFGEMLREIFDRVSKANKIFAAYPADLPRLILIDGKPVTSLDGIDLIHTNTIEFRWSFANAAMYDFLNASAAIAPHDSGDYASAFVLYDEDNIVRASGSASTLARTVLAMEDSGTLSVTNRMPYARNIEPSWGGKNITSSAPNGVFEAALESVYAKYGRAKGGKLSTLYFTYRNHPDIISDTRKSAGAPLSIQPTLVATDPRYRPKRVFPKR